MRKINKRGQEGMLMWIAAAIIIVLVVAIVAYYIYKTSTGVAEGLGTITPAALEGLNQKCRLAITAGTSITYCDYVPVEFKERNEPVYVNCEYPDVQASLKNAGVNIGSMKCNPTDSLKTTAGEFCDKLKAGDTLAVGKTVLISNSGNIFYCTKGKEYCPVTAGADCCISGDKYDMKDCTDATKPQCVVIDKTADPQLGICGPK